MRVIQIILTCLFIFSFSKTVASNADTKYRVIKNDRIEVEWVIIQEDYYSFGKGSVVVLLKHKTTKEQIRLTANEIRNTGNRKEYNPFFMSYYLPGMKVNAGSYASSHFDPGLDVKIYETNLELNPPATDSVKIDKLFEQAKSKGSTKEFY